MDAFDFSTLLRTKRDSDNLTQKDLAAALHVSTSYIRRMEHRPCNLKLKTLRKLSAYFGMEIGTLLGSPAQRPYPAGETLGMRLKRLRDEAHMRQDDLIHDEYGNDGGMIRYTELENGHGNPTIRTLSRVSERLGVAIGDVVDGTVESNDEP